MILSEAVTVGVVGSLQLAAKQSLEGKNKQADNYKYNVTKGQLGKHGEYHRSDGQAGALLDAAQQGKQKRKGECAGQKADHQIRDLADLGSKLQILAI